jgi:hypothetical protein
VAAGNSAAVPEVIRQDRAMSDTQGQPVSPVLARLLPAIGGSDTIDRLAGLSGSDFTSVMLEVMRRRAARETPATVLRRYQRDRFVRPGSTPWRSLRRAEDLLTAALPGDIDLITLAPLVPLGTHSALATVSQDKIVTAIRPCEVAADPTNALALEAAARRVTLGRAGDRTPVRLAAAQRVVRAQHLDGAGRFAHFSLYGLVTAGPDEGSGRFERQAAAEHLRWAVAGLAAAGLDRVEVALTPLSGAGEDTVAALGADLAGRPATVVTDRDRASGRGYYRDLCFKIHAVRDGARYELGDGGLTDWTQSLTASGKERLLISGVGLDRLAAMLSP